MDSYHAEATRFEKLAADLLVPPPAPELTTATSRVDWRPDAEDIAAAQACATLALSYRTAEQSDVIADRPVS